jgi:DNA-directed RNA polymerase subunit omega
LADACSAGRDGCRLRGVAFLESGFSQKPPYPPTDSLSARRALGRLIIMRDDYLQKARQIISDPNILVNVVSRRVKQLRRGSRPLVVSLEKLAPEDIALREIIEGLITYRLPTAAELAER